jgi:CRISPR/Cas system endoribonuclease Cas6 (RAMP superfamily)
MATQRVSDLFEEKKTIDSNSFTSLSPVMKEAVETVLKLSSPDGDVIKTFDEAVDKTATQYKVNKQDIIDYFDNELKEQLGE